MDANGFDNKKPNTVQGNLANPPRALASLIARPQWCVWQWERDGKGRWQKPPFMARCPDRHASSSNPETWTDFATALGTLQADRAEGLTYMLTKEEPLAAIDVDHCRERESGNLDEWAQALLARAGNAYAEITPSGSGIRFWGTAFGESLSRNIRPLSVGPEVGIEFYRRPQATKPLTITGLQIGASNKLVVIDALVDRTLAWAEQHKGVHDAAEPGDPVAGLFDR
jgi:primase-polymerase (primpol)-like protein